MSVMRAPTYPASANTALAAVMIRSRVTAAFSRRVSFGGLTAGTTTNKLPVVITRANH